MLPENIKPSDILLAEDVAKLLKVSSDTVYRYARNGKIPHIKVGTSSFRFPAWKIDEWMEQTAVIKNKK